MRKDEEGKKEKKKIRATNRGVKNAGHCDPAHTVKHFKVKESIYLNDSSFSFSLL
jgi:hypothetical protein